MDIQSTQDRIIREFQALDDWTQRYKYIIKHGSKLEPMPEEEHTEDNLIRGCQSRVWLTANFEDGKLKFRADSDAAITKGLVSLVVRLYDNQTPDTIINTEPDFIAKIGMAEHLSPSRANGLLAMIKQMKLYAVAFKEKEKA